MLPAAILQNPIFHIKKPKYLNYGLLGTMIGRELIRAFVEFAKESDEKCPTLRQIQCLREQYFSYNYSNVPVSLNNECIRNFYSLL